jgi:hypothetical protein
MNVNKGVAWSVNEPLGSAGQEVLQSRASGQLSKAGVWPILL